MGPCYNKPSKKNHTKSLYNTAIVNLKPNEIENKELQDRQKAEILIEKKELRKNLDEKYSKIPNFFNVTEKNCEENLYGAVGLFNGGNTCFINSALQLLSNTQPLTDYFLSGLHIKEINENNPFGSQGSVVYQFGLLLKYFYKSDNLWLLLGNCREIWITKEPAIEPTEFLDILKKYAPRFSEGNQEDIQEFLIYLLDIIHEDLNRVFKAPIKDFPDQIQIEINENLHKENSFTLSELELCAAKEWQNYLRKNRSIIVDLFQGQIKNTVKCLNCMTLHHKFEPIMYISVPIPQSEEEDSDNEFRFDIDLMECLKEFTKEEKLENTETFYCENCKNRSECTKKIEIWKMPNILIIHFKRFKYNKKQKKKMDTFINFPLKNLDLSSFQSIEPKEKPIYDLFGVANHEGTLNKGHYYSFAKNDENKLWYLFDDELVKLIKKPHKQVVSSHAYMLFYAKTSSDYFFRQTLTAPELWPHLVKIQETLLLHNKGGKIRSSTGIRESLRLQNLNSLTNSFDNKPKSIEKGLFMEMMKAKEANYSKKIGLLTSKSTEDIVKKTQKSRIVNNFLENQGEYKESNYSQKQIKEEEEDSDGRFFERMDNLAEKKLKILNNKKKIITIIEEETNGCDKNDSEVLKGRKHVEFIYKEEEKNGTKLEIINN